MVREESADTEECGSCQLNNMDMDMDENQRNRATFPAVSRSAVWHEPKFMCDKQCWEKGFKYHAIASVIVEDECEPHMINILQKLVHSEQGERKKVAISYQPSR